MAEGPIIMAAAEEGGGRREGGKEEGQEWREGVEVMAAGIKGKEYCMRKDWEHTYDYQSP